LTETAHTASLCGPFVIEGEEAARMAEETSPVTVHMAASAEGFVAALRYEVRTPERQ
jgi:hypothetical protein